MEPSIHIPPNQHAAPLPADKEGNGSHRLQDVLPDIYGLAQKVGGMKRLAELVKTLEESKE